MFESITERLSGVFRTVMGKARLSGDNIAAAMAEVRIALLEADVNLDVVRNFTERVKEKAIGAIAVAGVDPGQQFVKAVFDGIVELLGGANRGVDWAASGPTVVMLCGLQGAGKTTTAAKLAHKFKADGRSPMLAAADVQRPAAVEQLKVLGEQIGVPVHSQTGADPVAICRQSLAVAELRGCDVVILDTAGRLHVDEALMAELEAIVKVAAPREVLFVCDAMIGQSAVDTAKEFRRRLPITGAVMTKLDGDARGGAALSLAEASGVSIKFVTTGEKPDALEDFHPERMAQRILGMGDVVSLVERAQAVVDEKEAQKLQKKMMENTFTLEDFLNQLGYIRKMGSLKDLLGMIPGFGAQMKDLNVDDRQFKGIEALIQSMTVEERRHPELIEASRRRRIAAGSGRQPREIVDLLKQFEQMRKIMGQMGKMGMFGGGGAGALKALMSGGLPGMGGGRTMFGSKKAGTKAQQKKKRDKKKKRR